MLIHFLNINDYIKNDYIAQIGIKSWRKYMPEHQIKIWTENDDFIKNILNDKNNNIIKWYSNISNFYIYEYLRLKIIYEFGGIFSEPDMVLLEHFDVQNNDEFFYNARNFFNLGITSYPIILKKNNILIKMLLDYIENNLIKNNIYNEFKFCKLSYIKDNQDFEKNYTSLLNKTKFFEQKSVITNKIFHLCDFFVLDEFKKDFILIFSKEETFNFYEVNYKLYNLAHFRIFNKNPKILKFQIAYLKYIIFNHQELKEKIIDFENLLGDLDKISPKDWEILNDI